MPSLLRGMTVTQLRIPNTDLRELRRIAKREQVSVAELIRRAIADSLDRRNGGAA